MASAGKRGRNPGAQDFFRLGLGQEASSQCKYIGIIVFPAISGGSFIIAQGRPDARHLVRRHGRTDTRAIDQNTARGRPGSHQVGHFDGDIGIVGILAIVDSHVANGELERLDERLERFFQGETAVVRADGDGLIGRGKGRTLVVGDFDEADSTGRGYLTRRGRDDGVYGDAPIPRQRHIFGSDYTAHKARSAIEFVRIIVMEPHLISPDYLARLLHQGSLSAGLVLVGMAVAFALGALHALSPGHGKTIVAAYLVGSQSSARHAVLLGAVVTLTHTGTVFLLGFATLFLSRLVMPEKIYPLFGTLSGLAIVWVGASLFVSRLRAARKGRQHEHRFALEGEASFGSLLALGASGGLVPCPSALVLLLSSVALGRIGIGLTLLVAFSLGLAVVLVAIGIAAVYGKKVLPKSESAGFRYLPVASAALITVIGVAMTAAALGVVRL